MEYIDKLNNAPSRLVPDEDLTMITAAHDMVASKKGRLFNHCARVDVSCVPSNELWYNPYPRSKRVGKCDVDMFAVMGGCADQSGDDDAQ